MTIIRPAGAGPLWLSRLARGRRCQPRPHRHRAPRRERIVCDRESVCPRAPRRVRPRTNIRRAPCGIASAGTIPKLCKRAHNRRERRDHAPPEPELNTAETRAANMSTNPRETRRRRRTTLEMAVDSAHGHRDLRHASHRWTSYHFIKLFYYSYLRREYKLSAERRPSPSVSRC